VKSNGVIKIITIILVGLTLCGCPATHYTIFVRNNHSDTAYIKIEFEAVQKEYYHKQWDSVKFTNHILEINKHTLPQLNKTLHFTSDSIKAVLIIPPLTTAYITPFLEYPNRFAKKALIIERNGKSDSIKIQYPYKNFEWTTKKRGKSTYIARTIFGYDIK
jgi:hypothetical protein